MSADRCDTDRMEQLSGELADTRRTLEEYRRDVDKLTKDLDALKNRLRRGLGQVLADGDRKGS